VGRSGVATAEFTDTEYEVTTTIYGERMGGEPAEQIDRSEFRSGTEYYGWIIDVYSGNNLIKVVASNSALFHQLGRDRNTGFPR